MNYASIGSISHGTLLTTDLLEAFADELDYQVQRNAEAWCSDDGRRERDRLVKLVWDAREWEDQEGDAIDLDETGAELVGELQDALSTFAAPYCYFGANEGDGSDFGYWPDMDAIEDLPKVADPADVEGMGEDCVFVSDHGNVTVYGADGKVIWDCV